MLHQEVVHETLTYGRAPALPDCDTLVRTHASMVRRIAWQVHSRMSSAIALEDLMQIGLLSLVEAITYQKLDQRLAALLLAKGDSVHATHQALADELGSVREIVSRLLRAFEDKGWVDLARERIEVTDRKALQALVGA